MNQDQRIQLMETALEMSREALIDTVCVMCGELMKRHDLNAFVTGGVFEEGTMLVSMTLTPGTGNAVKLMRELIDDPDISGAIESGLVPAE